MSPINWASSVPKKLLSKSSAAFSHFHSGHTRPLHPRQETCPNPSPGAAVLGSQISISDQGGAYARATRLSDGSILGGFTHFEGDTRILQVTKSTDGGQTFTPFGEVARGTGNIDNLFLLEIEPSVVLAAFRNHVGLGANPEYARITVCKSTDGGKTWVFSAQAFEMPGPLGLWEPFMRLGNNPGEIQLTYSQEFAPQEQRTMLTISTDQGGNWSEPKSVSWQAGLRDGMNGIAKTVDDNSREALVMVFETTKYNNKGKGFNVESAISYDDGRNWENRQDVYVPPDGRNAGAPQITSFADGSLAVVFMTDEDTVAGAWPEQADVKVIFAAAPTGGTLCWGPPQVVGKSPSSWPGLLTIEDNKAIVTYNSGQPIAKAFTWSPA
ncbi:hypothetical protein FQN51_007903 [Onygenales sp. PD_10]|nr:hypothetical protein FQN51_007903 [Onygenales sp. PD_10]